MDKRGRKADDWSFRWGVRVLDLGFTSVPNAFLRMYTKLGLTRPEFLFILHLASYHFESEHGVCRPSLHTIAREMGYSVRMVQDIRFNLEKKGLLTVHFREGDTSIYSFAPFSRLALQAYEADQELARSNALNAEDASGEVNQSSGGGRSSVHGGGEPEFSQRRKEKKQTNKKEDIPEFNRDMLPERIAETTPEVCARLWGAILADLSISLTPNAFACLRPTELLRIEQRLPDPRPIMVVSHPSADGVDMLQSPYILRPLLQTATTATGYTGLKRPKFAFVVDGRAP